LKLLADEPLLKLILPSAVGRERLQWLSAIL